MNPIYSVQNTGPLTTTKVKTWVNVYGITCKIEISTFVIHGLMGIRINFEPDTSSHRAVKGARYTNRLFFRDNSSEGTREVEQHIRIYPTVSEIASITDFKDFNDEQIEQLSISIIKSFKSVINYARENIYSVFAKEFRIRACEFLDQSYHKKTEESISGVLSSLNWPLLFQNVSVPDNFVDLVESVINEYDEELSYPLLYDGEIDVETLHPISAEDNINEFIRRALQEEERAKKQKKHKAAFDKARALLLRVCGKSLYDEYIRTDCICIKKENGWKFIIGKSFFIETYDSQGNKAELCVHTAGLSCHKIDEIVIAYLHIMHDYDDFLARAHVWNHHPKFDMTPFRRKVKHREQNE